LVFFWCKDDFHIFKNIQEPKTFDFFIFYFWLMALSWIVSTTIRNLWFWNYSRLVVAKSSWHSLSSIFYFLFFIAIEETLALNQKGNIIIWTNCV